jgi:hypothetical protein
VTGVETAGGAPAVIVAAGTALAAVVAAYTAARKKSTTADAVVDPEDLPGRLRERLSSAEARLDNLEPRVDRVEAARRRSSRSSS